MKNLPLPANVAFIGIASAKLGIYNALTAFVTTGAIPGTPLYIPSGLMLLISITGLWLMILGVALPLLVRSHTLQITTPPNGRLTRSYTTHASQASGSSARSYMPAGTILSAHN